MKHHLPSSSLESDSGSDCGLILCCLPSCKSASFVEETFPFDGWFGGSGDGDLDLEVTGCRGGTASRSFPSGFLVCDVGGTGGALGAWLPDGSFVLGGGSKSTCVYGRVGTDRFIGSDFFGILCGSGGDGECSSEVNRELTHGCGGTACCSRGAGGFDDRGGGTGGEFGCFGAFFVESSAKIITRNCFKKNPFNIRQEVMY